MVKKIKTIKDIQKKYGDGAIFKLGDTGNNIERITTGFIGLDEVLGGGVPIGRIMEVYGQESSGKTTLCQHIIAEAQKDDKVCVYLDMEHALDPSYATKCGVNINELYISQPSSGEECLEIAQILIDSGAVDVIVVDSVAALVPRAEIEGEMGQAHMGLQARLMGQAMRKLSGPVKKNNVTLIFVNQLRKKIGGFGNPNVTTGGNALKFYASIRLNLVKIKTRKDGGDIIRIQVKKNKTAPPFTETELTTFYGKGFSKEYDLLMVAINKKIIEKAGAWFKFKDVKLQGEISMLEWLGDTENYRIVRECIQ